MNYSAFTGETLFIASDLTAGIFLIVLILSIAFRSERRPGIIHLLASVIFELTGILLRLFASTVEKIPADFAWEKASAFLTPVSAPVIWMLSFLLIGLGITESATYTIYINGGRDKSSFRIRIIATGIILVAGATLYLYFGNVITIIDNNGGGAGGAGGGAGGAGGGAGGAGGAAGGAGGAGGAGAADIGEGATPAAEPADLVDIDNQETPTTDNPEGTNPDGTTPDSTEIDDNSTPKANWGLIGGGAAAVVAIAAAALAIARRRRNEEDE